MKILFANARPPYPFCIGGDGQNIHALFSFLSAHNHTCHWLGTTKTNGYETPGILRQLIVLYTLGLKPVYKFRWQAPEIVVTQKAGYTTHISDVSRFIPNLRQLISNTSPDIIITQLEKSEEVMFEANAKHIPFILFITDAENENITRLTAARKYHAARVFCVSKFVKTAIGKKVPISTQIVYPPVQITEYQNLALESKTYLTCINPVQLKGGAVLEKIIRCLPDKRFLLVKGWYDPIIDLLNFRQYPNVQWMDKQISMRTIYNKTKILLVPSLWNEAIPRIILEAGINGIPSIASKRGGMQEAVLNGGILIHNPMDIQAWVKAINRLDNDSKLYGRLSMNIRSHARKFSVEIIGPKFEHICQQILSHQ